MGKHSEWRKEAKKARRKRIRQHKARIRDQCEEEERQRRENSPSYQLRIAKQEEEKRLFVENEARLARLRELEYQKVEAEVQRQFLELQRKLAHAREERARQNEKVREEWQREQERQKIIREKEELEQQRKIQEQEELDAKVNDFLVNGGDTPEHLKRRLETNPNKPVCQFFEKIGACRFFDVCSRNHVRPNISRIILIPNFFSHISLQNAENEHGADSTLEFERHETYNAYREFFYDVIPEMETFGTINVFKTCSNHEAHLRGNVYVEFIDSRSALKCYRKLNGRWYGGKQISVQFCSIPSWRRAICGLDFSSKCPKGTACNFMHVFRNPRNLYNEYLDHVEKDRQSSRRNWRWSESPEPLLNSYEFYSRSHRKTHNSQRSTRQASSGRSSRRHRISRSPSMENSRESSSLRNTRWSESPERISKDDHKSEDYRSSKSHSERHQRQSSSRKKSSSDNGNKSSRSQRRKRSRSQTPDKYK